MTATIKQKSGKAMMPLCLFVAALELAGILMVVDRYADHPQVMVFMAVALAVLAVQQWAAFLFLRHGVLLLSALGFSAGVFWLSGVVAGVPLALNTFVTGGILAYLGRVAGRTGYARAVWPLHVCGWGIVLTQVHAFLAGGAGEIILFPVILAGVAAYGVTARLRVVMLTAMGYAAFFLCGIFYEYARGAVSMATGLGGAAFFVAAIFTLAVRLDRKYFRERRGG